MKSTAYLFVGISFSLASGCTTHRLQDYHTMQPKLELNDFFQGQLEAVGIVQDRSDRVIRRFTADIVAQWQGDRGILDEQFVFDDGEHQHRCWRLEKHGDDYRGRAGDVIGEAVGRVAGNTLHWQYTLRVPVDGKVWDLTLDDWLYRIDDNNIINRTRMKKWGFEVGKITLNIRRVDKVPQRAMTRGCTFDEDEVV